MYKSIFVYQRELNRTENILTRVSSNPTTHLVLRLNKKMTVKLNMNECPYPPPPKVIQAAEKGLSVLNRYASPEDFEGMYSVRAVGSMLGARDMERRDFLGLMNIIFGNPALAQGALSKVPEWISRAMDYFKIRSPADLYESVDDFEPMDLQSLMEMGAKPGRGGGPGMLPGGQAKPQGMITGCTSEQTFPMQILSTPR